MNTWTFWIVLAVWLFFGSAGIQQIIRGYRGYGGRRNAAYWANALPVMLMILAWHSVPAGIAYLICHFALPES